MRTEEQKRMATQTWSGLGFLGGLWAFRSSFQAGWEQQDPVSSGALKNWRSSEKPLDESGALAVCVQGCEPTWHILASPKFISALSKVVFGSSLQAPTDNRPGKEAESFLLVAARPALGDGRSELS